MTRIKIHISNVKLPFYPPCEVKCGLQNRMSTACRSSFLKKAVRFSFLHGRLLSLWKSMGKIDCVDLGKEFFLIQKDYKVVLRDGPWFIGENFLSIRP